MKLDLCWLATAESLASDVLHGASNEAISTVVLSGIARAMPSMETGASG